MREQQSYSSEPFAASSDFFGVVGLAIRERISGAIADGRLVQCSDGRYRLTRDDVGQESLTSDTPTILTKGSFAAPCRFLNHFLFGVVYGETQVPFGCRACYKIWISPPTLRGLFALKDLLDGTPYSSKIKVEALNPLSPNVYLALIYCGDLPETRAAFAVLRRAVNADPRLGKDLPMDIRRGCQNYEQKCGPSDQYRFDPELESLEETLFTRFAVAAEGERPKKQRDAAAKLRMIQIAHQLGDETYRDFTNGRSLSISPVRYASDADIVEE